MEKIKLSDIIQQTISGEWGTDIKDEEGTYVIRTADFNNDGTINYENVIKRSITTDKIKEKCLKVGDIIVEKSGGTDRNPVGRVVLFDRQDYKCLANNFTQVLRIKDEYYYKYFFYQLFYKYKCGNTLKMFNKTTGIQNLQMKMYLAQDLNICSKDEQIEIANKLDKVQRIIDIRKKQIEELEKLIKSQFNKMFQKNTYKKINLNKISELITKGTTPTSIGFSFQNEGINFIKLESIDENGNFISNKFAYVNQKCHERLKRSQLKENDILFSIAGAIGRTAIVTDSIVPANTNQALAIIRANDKYNKIFLKEMLNSEYVIKQFSKKKQGVAQINISLKDVGDFEIFDVPLDEQNEYSQKVIKINTQKVAILKSLKELQMLQESLMSRYFN